MTAYPSLRRNGPRYPCRPKIKTNINPATTGDTANGKSIIAVSKVRPGKSKREMAHAAVRPKRTFAANAMGTTVMVRRIECCVSGSPMRFLQYTPAPWLNATAKTLTTGTTNSNTTTTNAKSVSPYRSHAGSCWARLMMDGAPPGWGETVSVFMTHTPAFDHIDQHEHRERHHQQDHRDRGGFTVGKLLQARDDEDGSDLRVERLVSRYKNDRAVLPDTAGKGERKAGDQRRVQRGQNNVPERLPSRPAKRCARFLRLRIEIFENGLHRAHHERQADKDQHQHYRKTRISPVNSERHQVLSQPAFLDVQAAVHQSADRRRQSQRQVDQRIHDLLAGITVADQDPGESQPQNKIRHRRNKRRSKCEHVRGTCAFGPDRPREFVE